jgi:long-chain acyl-CoA synthetase
MAGSGEVVTYGQLDARSNQGAHLFRSLGLKPATSSPS